MEQEMEYQNFRDLHHLPPKEGVINTVNVQEIFNSLEMWKPLTNYDGQYEISNHGNVRSVEREVLLFGRIPRTLKSQPILTRGHVKGYRRFCVYKNNIKETIFVHRAIAIAFLPNPEDLPVVNHKDLDKQNNHTDNLEWVTCKENTQHYYDNKDEEF